jgi:hypothetical protein
MDASLVPCSVNDGLNREKTLSDHHKVLTDNLGEENQPTLTHVKGGDRT